MHSDISLTTTKVGTGGPSWAADFPTDVAPITLDADLVLATYTDGVIPSGAVLARITATDRLAPYVAGGTGGAQTPAGHLLSSRVVRAGKHVDAALYHRGRVYEDLLPSNSRFDAAARTALAGSIYYDKVGA